VADKTPVPVVEVPPHTFREQFFRKSSHDLSGLPTPLKAEMSRLVNRGPTPEIVAFVKHKWANKKASR